MKRLAVLAVLILIPVALLSPIIYGRWREGRRVERIKEAKASARRVEGISLREAISAIKGGKEDICLVFTGDTEGRLEPCGCYEGQAGGIARIATIVSEMRKKVPTCLLDVGNIAKGEDEIDIFRIKRYLKIMDMIGYDATGIGDGDLRFGTQFLRKAMKMVGFPFISSNLFLGTEPLARESVIKDVSDIRIGITGVSHVSPNTISKMPGLRLLDPVEALKREVKKLKRMGASFTIVLSTLPMDENRKIAKEVEGIDLILGLGDQGARGKGSSIHGGQGKVTIWNPGNDGKTVGIGLIENGRLGEYRKVVLGDDIPEDPAVRDKISEFYSELSQTFAPKGAIKKLFSSEPMETDRGNAYIGSEQCRSCHNKQYEQWETTPHAFAFQALVQKQRQFYSGCVLCHSTGYGYPTGFRIGDPGDHLKGVGCESCHGPGKRHAMDPSSTNIRGKVGKRICAECHTEEHSPGFMDVVELLIPEVDHKRQMDLKEFLKAMAERSGKVKLELFTMSYCPFGIAAQRRLFPIIKELGDKIDFSLYFIARERGPKDPPGIEFISLHGVEEVGEDIRQLVISKLYPDRYMDYILCRGRKGKDESWEKCARKFGIDIGKVRMVVEGEEGKRLFRENIKKAKDLNISTSPTLLINGRAIGGRLLLGLKGGCGG
jgi:glutaredoxin